MTLRTPCVAGQFYPSSRSALKAYLQETIVSDDHKKDAYAVIMPHAGYMYSGATAAKTISRVNIPQTVFMLGPNHTGLGEPFSIMTNGSWITPLGQVSIDEELAEKVVRQSSLIEEDDVAHKKEHSLEVELPFLQHVRPDVNIVPMAIGSHDLHKLREVAEAIGSLLMEYNVLILVSSDMTHYESEQQASEKDRKAIDAIIRLDEKMLAAVVAQHNISMCGFAPAYMALIMAKIMGAQSGELVEYTTSGAVTGDTAQVVGYAGMIIV
ncbi:MAG: AmmeMemoRadiSam system protein B [Candidatus Omnitrophica bacterium]|nr:AmmeMemoRadiSam system protein B [Candidatus Omnitrophota bacterium]